MPRSLDSHGNRRHSLRNGPQLGGLLFPEKRVDVCLTFGFFNARLMLLKLKSSTMSEAQFRTRAWTNSSVGPCSRTRHHACGICPNSVGHVSKLQNRQVTQACVVRDAVDVHGPAASQQTSCGAIRSMIMKTILSALLALSFLTAVAAPASAAWDVKTFWDQLDRSSY